MTLNAAKHITWKNLNEIHTLNLLGKNKEICYTGKVDGIFCTVEFKDTSIYIKTAIKTFYITISSKDKIILNHYNIDDIRIIGEILNEQYVYLFDLEYLGVSKKYSERHKLLKIIYKKLQEKIYLSQTWLEFIIKEYVISDISKCPIDDDIYDGYIIYYNNQVNKLKWNNRLTIDLWLDNINNQLYTEDGVFMGFLRNCRFKCEVNQYDNKRNIRFRIAEVIKSNCDNSGVYCLCSFRDDKSHANKYSQIEIDYIPCELLKLEYASVFLQFKLNISKYNKLTLSYYCFKKNMFNVLFKCYKKPLTWLDIGCGSGNDLYNAILSSKTVAFRKIYLMDNNTKKINRINNRLKKLKGSSFIPPITLINTDINTTSAYNQIASASIEICTIFLSAKKFDSSFFRNINKWLKPNGRICIIFYDDTMIPHNGGIYSTDNEFGIRICSETEIEVYRMGEKEWKKEPRLNKVYLEKIFEEHGYLRTIANVSPLCMDEKPNIYEMMMAITFKRNLNKSVLYNISKSDSMQIILSFLKSYEVAILTNILGIYVNGHKPYEKIDLYDNTQHYNAQYDRRGFYESDNDSE
tara:strand:- start:879 stop:2612 length:1734 start_codon:yes stop_codon:yes gene_type:complete